MSEPIGTQIEVGGILPLSFVEALLMTVHNALDNLIGPMTIKELEYEIGGGATVVWDGTSEYGLCKEVTNFCEKHELSYVVRTEAKDEYNATTCYWTPGMNEAKSFYNDVNGAPIVKIHEIQPICELMLAMISEVDKALPRFLDTPQVLNLVKTGLEDYSKLPEALKIELDSLLPNTPENFPAFEIKYEA